MTAGPAPGRGAAAAAGLIERFAEAFTAAVPADPADDGFFGPASVTWRVSADLSAPVAGLRSLMMQALHPLAMAGVDQHSAWRLDPAGRLAATSGYTATVTYGDRASAARAAARVRAIHEHVRGVDAVTGRRYAASDPALLLWVHAALVDSALAACALFGTPLASADADRYVAEMAVQAELLGVPRDGIPDSQAALRRYLDQVRPVLRRTPAAAESMGYLLRLPGPDEEIAGLWHDIAGAAIASLPRWARREYGWQAPPGLDPVTPQGRTQVRQALGVLDAVFLAEPGVLEARQRLELRRRAAGRA
ncbi:MAG TPA: oxygenase MpaB family protein [Streptosporangiaceae bacterium]|nr:oxygenase MpaB family protein [Streptosporangiaceae bacterium]